MKRFCAFFLIVLLWASTAHASVLYILRQDPYTDVQGFDAAALSEEAVGHLNTLFSVPGIKRLQAFQGFVGADRTLLMFRFSDLVAWSQWAESSVVQTSTLQQSRLYARSTGELWVPAPYLPVPIYLSEDVGQFLNVVRGDLNPEYGIGGARSDDFAAAFSEHMTSLAEAPGADEIRMYVPAAHMAPNMYLVIFSFQNAARAGEFMASESYGQFEAFLRAHGSNLHSDLLRPAAHLPDLVHVPEIGAPEVDEDRWEPVAPAAPVPEEDDEAEEHSTEHEAEPGPNGSMEDGPADDEVEEEPDGADPTASDPSAAPTAEHDALDEENPVE